MERAILATTHGKLGDTEHVHRDWTLVDEYPLSIELLAMSRVWRSPDRRAYVIAVKGAPEAVIDLCHVPATQAAHVLQQAEAMAARGLRVLGVAKASFESDALPSHQHDFDFVYVGMLGLADPVRPDVPGAIEECRAAGVRVVMLTGDHPATALSIARQIGLLPRDTSPETAARECLQAQRGNGGHDRRRHQ
jgi:Ca2+-transporting ATPase